MLCFVYSIIFIYTFAALGNLGLIERERVMLLPFLLVLLCIPRAPKGSPPRYLWELRRKARLQSAAGQRGGGGARPTHGRTVPVDGPTDAPRDACPPPTRHRPRAPEQVSPRRCRNSARRTSR